jgi:small subunit ribosomal protein S14
LTYIIQNSSLDLATREFAYAEIRNLMRFNSSTKIRNRCILTNRARAVYRKVKISRIFFKKLTLQGDLCGLKKSS